MTGTELMHESIWFDQPKYEEAECLYQLHLASKNGPASSGQASSLGASSLIDEIAKARENIKQSLSEVPSSGQSSSKSAASLEKENTELRKLIEDLTKRMSSLEARMTAVEGSSKSSQTGSKSQEAKKPEVKKEKEDDDDFDLFESSDEEDTEAEKVKEERVAKYHEKKAKKPALVAKSSILLDIKPWADDTDMVEMEKLVRGIETDGLVWGASKLVPVAFGIKKLQISCVVEDEKIGTDFLEETITDFDDHVQSVDIAAFNKI